MMSDRPDPGGDEAPAPEAADDLWDRALEEAFTRNAGNGPAAFSSGPRTGRYRLLGEIARGGMGVVHRAHDDWLRRDVALKVMRSEYAGQPELVNRFLDEAQVGGQLQHPGIVPIHDVGVDSSNRPFICMELVRGRTLASLLADRNDPAADRGQLLAAFEQVCQTLAYAHSRGVIHRDLKPSNVMVGAFGEIRVVDWGFAKVRGMPGRGPIGPAAGPATPPPQSINTHRSASDTPLSSPGSVLGTPGYMSPEQARGEADDLDERADVFALGAILCEILTGKRPFVSEDGIDPIEATRAGNLAHATARLAACDADPALVRLAERCLDPSRERRPHDAAEVAKAIADHRAHSDERVRATEMEAAEIRGRAAEENRWRRRRLLLSATVVIALLAAGAVVAWREHEISVRDGVMKGILDEFDQHAKGGHWDPAENALNRARGIMSVGTVSPALATRAEEAGVLVRANTGPGGGGRRRGGGGPPPREGGPPPDWEGRPPPPPPGEGGFGPPPGPRRGESRPRPRREIPGEWPPGTTTRGEDR